MKHKCVNDPQHNDGFLTAVFKEGASFEIRFWFCPDCKYKLIPNETKSYTDMTVKWASLFADNV